MAPNYLPNNYQMAPASRAVAPNQIGNRISTSSSHCPLIEPGDPIPRPRHNHRSLELAEEAARQREESTDEILRKLPFARIVREVCQESVPVGMDMRWQSRAILCLQEAAEAYLLHIFEQADLCALRNGRVMITPEDMQMARRMTAGEDGGG